MKAADLMRILKRSGCIEVKAKGSHVKVRCGACGTVVSIHGGDIPKGTLHAIIKDLEPCLGKDWHKK